MNADPIRLGLSPCPNDTFICDALLNGKIDTEGLCFEPVFADVEALNRMAFQNKLPITKVSFHAFLKLAGHYRLLESGCALGRGCGPLLISRKDFELQDPAELKVAIPGLHTTANLLFSLAFPDAVNKEEYLFSEIEDAVLQSKVDVGLLIHESRFTYMEKGLKSLMDLGSFWEGMTGLPIPLGGFIVSRNTSPAVQTKLNRVFLRSIDFSLAHPEESNAFVKTHAQEMEDEVISAHIGLYVNHFTRQLGEEGKDAIFTLFAEAHDAGIEVYQSRDFFAALESH